MAQAQDTNAPGMPTRADDAVKCTKGGKHVPTTREHIYDGTHKKYKLCTKCDRLLP
ncbi:hypothetical protein HWB05_gp185 [Streptomyces phage BRock]|uniref:Uncharacterized protein n=1 Tax=Streptomyces phage BRock TaxID=1913591 RepID=A0A1J0GW79_9CAUD|nr:hypothetical protein HWB05_gp185 [Streptomyces phage BRock]APC46432.1 hypothetical protein [Streptomyces phage BRock]